VDEEEKTWVYCSLAAAAATAAASGIKSLSQEGDLRIRVRVLSLLLSCFQATGGGA
jgi:hypothetical protein